MHVPPPSTEYVPAGHVDPSAMLEQALPAGQGVHASVPAAAGLAGAATRSGAYVPVEHGTACDVVLLTHMYPAAHGAQVVLRPVENQPGSQVMGVAVRVGHRAPGGQSMQRSERASEYWPSTQSYTAALESVRGHAEPARQLVRDVAAASEYVPATHCVGGVLVELHAQPAGQVMQDVAPASA